MKKSFIIFILVLISIMALGCASMFTVKEMPIDIDEKVKNLEPPSGKSLLYIVRPTWVGKPFSGHITANDEFVGTTQGNIYVFTVLDPGEYKIKLTGHDNVTDILVNL